MGYDEFWDIRDEDGVPPSKEHRTDGTGRTAYLICLCLWACWTAYLAVWLVTSLAGLPTEESAGLLADCGAPAWAAYYAVGGLELFGAGAWAFAAAGVLRIACAAIAHATGHVPEAVQPGWAKAFVRAWTGLHAVTVLCAIICSAYVMSPFGGMMRDPTGAGPLVALLAGPIASVGCVLGCVACAVVAGLSMPMMRATVKWASLAWSGANGR